MRRAGDRLRISAQLVDTSTGFQLWSDVYKHELQDVFLIQEEIAHAIVKALRLELLGDTGIRLVTPGTDSSQAYDKYLEGRNVLQARTPSAAQRAISIFEEALEFDPNYAQAYAGLADSWIVLRDVGNLSLLEATQRSHEAISKALQLDVALDSRRARGFSGCHGAFLVLRLESRRRCARHVFARASIWPPNPRVQHHAYRLAGYRRCLPQLSIVLGNPGPTRV